MAKSGPIEDWSPFRAYSPGRGSGFGARDIIALLVIALISWGIYCRASHLPEYHWNWSLLLEFVARKNAAGDWECGLLTRGFFTTLRISFWTIFVSLLLGAFIGLLNAGKNRSFSCLSQIYINLFRNIPPLVILFTFYFIVGNIVPVQELETAVSRMAPAFRECVAFIFAPQGQMDRMLAAIIALGLYQAAYVAEIIRAGTQSVAAGQWDAARALGFSNVQSLRLVILPQSWRLIIPPLTGQAISTFKESALASLISLPEMTFQSLEIMAISRMTFEIWLSTGLLYLLIGLFCSWLGGHLEKAASYY